MANGDDPTNPFEAARQVLEGDEELTEQQEAPPEGDGRGPTPFEAARQVLQPQPPTPTSRSGAAPSDSAFAAGLEEDQGDGTTASAPAAGTMGIPEPGSPDPTADDQDGMRNFFETIVTEAQRGFQMFQMQSAAQQALDAQDRGETAGQTSVSRASNLGPGTIAEEQMELSEEEQKKAARKAAETIERNANQLEEVGQTEAMKQMSDAIQTGEASAVWNAVWENPESAVGLAVQSSAMQPDALALTGLASMLAGPAGAGATAITGAAGANMVETRAAITEELRKRGVDLQNSEAVMKALQDPGFQQAARERGEARGSTIAAVDLATNLLTLGLGRTGLRPLAKGVLGFGTQTGGEAASEALAQQAAGEETNPAEILTESLASGPQSAIEVAGTAFQGERPADAARRRARELLREAEASEGTPSSEGGQAPAAARADQVGNDMRPYAGVDDARLDRMKQRARERQMTPEVEAIEREQRLREEATAEEADATGATADTEADRDTPNQDEAGPGEAGVSASGRRKGRSAAPDTPSDPAAAARQALEETQQVRQAAQAETDAAPSAADRLGVDDLPEDPAPEIDARRQESGDASEGARVTDEEIETGDARPATLDRIAHKVQAGKDLTGREEAVRRENRDAVEQRLQEAAGQAEQSELEDLVDDAERRTTRPEEQVQEEVARREQKAQQAKQQVERAKEDLLSTLQDADAAEIQRLADQEATAGGDPEVERLARMALEDQAQQGTLGDLAPEQQEDPATPQKPGLFGDRQQNVSSAVQDAADKLRQRRAGLQQKQQELLRARQGQPDAERQARDAQQDIDLDDTESRDQPRAQPEGEGAGEPSAASSEEMAEPALPPGEADIQVQEPVAPTQDEGDGVEDGGDGAAEEVATGPHGQVTARVGTPDGTVTRAGATLTDDAMTVQQAESPEAAAQLAEEAARRGVPLQTDAEVDPETAEAITQLAQQGYAARRHGSTERGPGGTYEADGPVFRVQAPQVDPEQPQLETEDGYTVGRALRPVTRKTTRPERPQGRMTDRPVAELEEDLQDARERGDAEYAQQVEQALQRIRTRSRQTTYRHARGDIVVQNPDGQLIDRRSAAYEDAVADYFAEHEEALRNGTVEPAPDDQHGARAALSSRSPQQVLDAYRVAHRAEQDRTNGGAQADPQAEAIESIGRIQTDSFRGMAGEAAVADGGALRMNWLSENGTPLDDAAQQVTSESGIETSPQDIVDHIEQNPTRSRRGVVDELKDHFKDLTGVTPTPELAEKVQARQAPDELSGDDTGAFEAPFMTADDLSETFESISEDGPLSDGFLLEAIVRRVMGEEGLPGSAITVVETASELEGEAARRYENAMRSAGAMQMRPAMFIGGPTAEADGQVYLIADQIGAMAKATGWSHETMARMTLMHEAAGHQGLRALLGDTFEETMDLLIDAVGIETVMNARTVGGTRLIDANADLVERAEDGGLTGESRRLLMDEYLANIAEGMAVDNTTMETLYQRMKTGVARVLNLRLTKAEFGVLLNAAKDNLRAAQSGNAVQGGRFNRLMDPERPTRWMVLGTGAERFDEDEAPGVSGVFDGPYDGAPRFEIGDSGAHFHSESPLRTLAEAVRKREQAAIDEMMTDDPEEVEDALRRKYEAMSRVNRIEETLQQGGAADGRSTSIDQVFRHDTLFEEYPEITDQLSVRMVDFPHMGMLDYDGGELIIGSKLIEMVKDGVKAETEGAVGEQMGSLKEALSTVMKTFIHELQHWVQEHEGWAVGGNIQENIPRARKQLTNAQNAAYNLELFGDARDAIKLLQDNFEDPSTAPRQDQLQVLEEAGVERVTDVMAHVRIAEHSLGALDRKVQQTSRLLEAAGVDPTNEAAVDQLRTTDPDSDAFDRLVRDRAHDMYQRTAGEIEARIVQERRHWSIPERQAEGFYEDVDVAYDPDDVITRFSTYSEDPDQLRVFADPDAEQEQNMVAVHNLSEENVRVAVQQLSAHIPVPSVATARYDHGFARFGTISLVGTPSLVDPERGVPTYDSDIWSPTSPDAQYDHQPGQVGPVLQALNEYAEQTGETSKVSSLDYKIREQDDRARAVSRLSRLTAAKLWYLDEVHDRQPASIPTKKRFGSTQTLLESAPMQEWLGQYDNTSERAREVAAEDPQGQAAQELGRALREAARRSSRAEIGEVDDSYIDAVAGSYRADDGTLAFGTIDQLFRKWREMQESPETVDRMILDDRLNQMIEEETEADTVRGALHPWATRKADSMFGDPYLESEQGRQLPPTLDNLVEVMTERSVQAAEDGMLTTLANARAAGAERFGSLEEVQQKRGRLRSKEQFDQVKEELKGDWEAVREQILPHYERGRATRSDLSNRLSARDDVTKALGEMMQRRLSAEQARVSLQRYGFEDVPATAVKEFVQFGRTLQESPTQHFESKPQRAVALDEFVAAIVPNTTDEEVKEMLAEEVGEVREYTDGNLEERQRTFQEASQGVRFQSLSTSQMGHRFHTVNRGKLHLQQPSAGGEVIALHDMHPDAIGWIVDKMDGHIPAPSEVIAEGADATASESGRVSLTAPSGTIDAEALASEAMASDATASLAISDFRTAIVPENLREERVEDLMRAGLRIREYGTEEGRRQRQAEMDEARFITRDFSRGEAGDGGPFAEGESDVPLQRPERPQTLGDYWTLFKAKLRRQFATRGDLPEDVYEAAEGRRGQIKAWLQRMNWALTDFEAALQNTFEGEALTTEQKERINEALSNGYREEDVQQGALFEGDPQIESAVPMTEFWFSSIPRTPEATRTEKTYIEDLPEPLQSATAELRDMVDAMSHAGIQTGLFRGQLKAVVEQNMGTYLTRSYRIHNEESYGAALRQAARELGADEGITMDPDAVPEDVPATAWNGAVGWFRQNHPHMSDEQIQARLLELLNQESQADFAGGRTLGSVGSAIYERRSDIPEALRALLGEYEDPAVNFKQSMVKVATAVANQALLNEVKKKGLGRFLFGESKVVDGVSYDQKIAAEGSRTMQPLNGLYTTPEIARAFEQFDAQEQMPAWQEAIMKLSVAVKTAKTVGSLKTQFRNYYGNILFALQQGHLFSPRVSAGAAAGGAIGAAIGGPVGAVPGAAAGTVAGLSTTSPKQQAWDMAWKSMRQSFEAEGERQEYQRMLELGIVGDAVRAGELEDLFQDLDWDMDDPQTGMGEIADKIVGATGQTLTKLYQLGDEIWKVYAFQIEKERYQDAKPEWPEQRVEEKAAEIVTNTYPTYSQVPEFLKKLRRLPTNAPFVSFFSEVFRTTYQSARYIKEDLADPQRRHIGMQRAVGMIMAQGAMTALYEVSKALTGYDDEDDEYLRRLLPSWSRYSNLFHLPAEEGTASYTDLGYLNPYKAYGEAAIAAMTGDEMDPWRAGFNALQRLLNPFISEEILSRKVREAILNRSTETGGPIANPALQQANPEEFWARRVGHVLKAFEPTTTRDLRGLYNAMTEKGLYQDAEPKQEILSLFAGQRIKTIDMAERIKWETYDFEEQYRNASRIFTDRLTQRGTVTAEEVERAYRKMVTAKSEIVEHMARDVDAAMNFGLDPQTAFQVMRANGVGKERALMAMAGQYVPRPDDNVLRSRIEAALSEGREQDAEILRRRRTMAVEAAQQVQQEFLDNHPSLDTKFEEVRRLLQDSRQQ